MFELKSFPIKIEEANMSLPVSTSIVYLDIQADDFLELDPYNLPPVIELIFPLGCSVPLSLFYKGEGEASYSNFESPGYRLKIFLNS